SPHDRSFLIHRPRNRPPIPPSPLLRSKYGPVPHPRCGSGIDAGRIRVRHEVTCQRQRPDRHDNARPQDFTDADAWQRRMGDGLLVPDRGPAGTSTTPPTLSNTPATTGGSPSRLHQAPTSHRPTTMAP